jgi:phosphomannomutase
VTGVSEALTHRAEVWVAQDPDSQTQAELRSLVEDMALGNAEAESSVAKLFEGRLRFGTAGIRGPLQPGPAGMNRVVIAQTTAGLAQYLLEKQSAGATGRLRAVVGCDARTNSAIFSQDTAAILAGYGIEAILLPEELPTPVLAFAVRYLEADVGVMITASHNPPQDNGYKVYLGGADEGSQIVPPVDADIEAHITRVAHTLAWTGIPQAPEDVISAPADIVQRYVESTVRSVAATSAPVTAIPVVYTAMHGVGAGTFFETVDAAGFPPVHGVAEQTKPDPDFPTVSFPNPEEEGALDLSFATAQNVGAALIIAHDPDADRLALALPWKGSYVRLTGNQVGAILGWHCALQARQRGDSGALANSLVSSPVLGKIAHHFKLDHVETLTGFKYVSRVPQLIFGFEEALGYLVSPDVVKDKDGISAGLMALDIAYTLAAEDRTFWDYLADIERAVGGFASGQITLRLTESEAQAPLSTLLRANPPTALGRHSVIRHDDFLEGVDGFPREDILRYYLDDDSRIIVRPSGTEPKLKVYLDTSGATSEEAQAGLVALDIAVRKLLATLS